MGWAQRPAAHRAFQPSMTWLGHAPCCLLAWISACTEYDEVLVRYAEHDRLVVPLNSDQLLTAAILYRRLPPLALIVGIRRDFIRGARGHRHYRHPQYRHCITTAVNQRCGRLSFHSQKPFGAMRQRTKTVGNQPRPRSLLGNCDHPENRTSCQLPNSLRTFAKR